MLTIRRVYLYLILAAGLGTLSSGAVLLLRSLIRLAFGDVTAGQSISLDFVQAGALLIVGLPVWAGHWWFAMRLVERGPAERAAVLRRLYLYVVLLAAVILGSTTGAYDALRDLFIWATHVGSSLYGTLESLPVVLVAAIVWGYHWQLAGEERTVVGEIDESATLRRWYVYGVAAGALIFLLYGTGRLIELLWRLAFGQPFLEYMVAVASPAATALVALPVWLWHWRWSKIGPVAEEDRHAVLRTVYLLVLLGTAVAVTLTQVSQVLYYGLARLLGVAQPGDTAEPFFVLLGGPIGFGIAYGAAWYYHRRALAAETAVSPDSPRRLGIRRLYQYLVALVSIAVFAIGLAQLLWTLGDLLTQTSQPDADYWRRQVSLAATLVVVGILTWIGHWRPIVAAGEARSLSRRLYVYLTLIGAVLACLFAGVSFIYRLLSLVLGVQQPAETLVDLTHSLGTVVTGGAVAYYHWRALRRDQQVAAEPAVATPEPLATPQAVLILTTSDGRVLRRVPGDQAVLERTIERVARELADGS